jgi:large subunit ribosomal protein L29
MKYSELRSKPDDQLEILLEDLDKDLFALRCELALARKVEKPHLLQEKRRDRAKIFTLLEERRQEAGRK